MPIPGLPQFTDEQLFQTVNVALPAWILLALFPGKKWAHTIATVAALAMAALYSGLIIGTMQSAGIDFGEMSTYKGVAKLLATPAAVLPAWVHYVAFDLWTGMWMARDAVARGVPQLLLIPCLFGTLMLGPMGLLLYSGLRMLFKEKPAATGKKSKSA